MIGRTISHYTILEELGEGGMGIVYKAEDTKLRRMVALKFLPPRLSSTSERQARFLQEAQAAATLNHPHVCTVFDIQEDEGQQFIVMEYVDGKTLREILQEGPLKLSEAIEYAIQTGEALQEAHASGVVHRDVKADNIMITSRGQVKVMDFGLAKLKGSLKLTRSTSTLGTLPYMAPEQIQGGEVDGRSDIFSSGVVLYEMLTGHLPFRGEHEAALMYSILNEEPEPLQQYMPDAPSELLHIVTRALEKESAERYQTVTDMLIDLRRVKKDSTRQAGRPLHDAAPPKGKSAERFPAGRLKISRRVMWIGIAGVIVLGSGLTLLLFPKGPELKLNPNRTFRTLHIPFPQIGPPSMSRDGNWVSFPAADENNKWDIYVMSLEAPEPTKVTQEACSWILDVALSPDASRIAYTRSIGVPYRWEVRVVPFQGGTSRTVADTGAVVAWTPDGRRIGYMRGGFRDLSSISGKLEVWSAKPDGTDHRCELVDSISRDCDRLSFCWSLDGAHIVWVRTFPERHNEVMVREFSTGAERQLTFDRGIVDEVEWISDDKILFVSNKSGKENVYVVPSGGGEAIQITYGSAAINAAMLSEDSQKLLLWQPGITWELWIANIDGSNARSLVSGELSVFYASFSPDHNSIVASMGESYGSESHLYMMATNGQKRRRLTFGPQIVGNCEWSPDGKWIAYSSRSVSDPVDSTKVYLIGASGSRAPRRLATGVVAHWLDDKTLVLWYRLKTYHISIEGGPAIQLYEDSLFAIPVAGGRKLVLWDHRKGHEGLWLAFTDSTGEGSRARVKLGPLGDNIRISPSLGFLVHVKGEENEIWRASTEDGKEERIGSFQGFSGLSQIEEISKDGKLALWLRGVLRSKLVLVEHPFE